MKWVGVVLLVLAAEAQQPATDTADPAPFVLAHRSVDDLARVHDYDLAREFVEAFAHELAKEIVRALREAILFLVQRL